MRFLPQLVTNILLAGVLTVLVLIWRRMPPTVGEVFTATTPEARRAIRLTCPAITLAEPANVNVNNKSLNVYVENTLLGVDVAQPIDVQIVK